MLMTENSCDFCFIKYIFQYDVEMLPKKFVFLWESEEKIIFTLENETLKKPMHVLKQKLNSV